MSFSSEVKEELSRHMGAARHCKIAEIAAIITMCGKISKHSEKGYLLRLQTENSSVSRKYFTLLRKTFNISTDIEIMKNPYLKKNDVYTILIGNQEDTFRILQTTKLILREEDISENIGLVQPLVVQKECCKRAFIRGAFLSGGSISDPEKFYHFEIVCQSRERAEQLQGVIQSFSVDAKIVVRKKTYVVYVKEGNQIVELLALMEANVALMKLENIRILKEMRNSVNRKVNCEAANIHKTVNAAVKQIEDIRLIEETIGFQALSESLEEIARLRLQYPDATLKELGTMLNPQVGKSGVNHRLRKLSLMAEEMRGNKEEHYYD